jgi:hypothetical protein
VRSASELPGFWDLDISIGGGSFWEAPREMLILDSEELEELKELRQRKASEWVRRERQANSLATKIRDFSTFLLQKSPTRPPKNGVRKTIQKRNPGTQTDVDELLALRLCYGSGNCKEPSNGKDLAATKRDLHIPPKESERLSGKLLWHSKFGEVICSAD